ncbi:Asp/Glu/hydantoin racemase [Niveomyces insectorum RCEF 264]|uniref:Asp/Glu/hydantoin racemase n=1 Tax=Niveomyces insectorum RCEF 264 TaxID=1081102 RepID=A0A167SMM7_9HYPO|nr:Asp/Glu/hydantoin racemase [Niveomyces insectorum RCEF 264]
MNQPKPKLRLGIIVPSSNTVLEPVTQRIVADLAGGGLDVTVHFARFRVIKIALSADADAQFAPDAMLAAARLLADARVDVIGWSGTSASWLGFASDEALCRAIETATGIPATSSVLAMNRCLLRRRQQRHRAAQDDVGLVTPYTADVNKAVQTTYRTIGVDIADARSRCAGRSENIEFAQLDEPTLDAMVADVVQNGASTVLIMCTNVRAAQRAKHWEDAYGIHVLDSVAAVVVSMLEAVGVQADPASVDSWGSVFKG